MKRYYNKEDFEFFNSGNDVLRSGHYYAIPICSTGLHLVDQWQTVKPASCVVNGTKSGFCNICGTLDTEVILSEGHSYDFWGNCTKCADKTGLAGVGESVGNFFGGIFGGDDGTGSAGDKNIFDQVGDKVDEVGNSIKDWAEGVKNDTTSLFNTVLTVVAFAVLVMLLPTLLPLIKAVFEGLTFAVKSVVSLFKDLSRSIKRKSRKRKRAYQR